MADTDTIRQQIVDQVLTNLRNISIANGYKTNAGQNVWEWRSVKFQAEELPALNFRDLDEPIEESSNGSERNKRQLHCQVEVVLKGDEPMKQVRLFLADIEKAINAGRITNWNGLVFKTRPRIARAILEQDSFKLAGSTFEFYLDYATHAFNSFLVAQ